VKSTCNPWTSNFAKEPSNFVNFFIKGSLNFDKIDTRSIDDNFMQTPEFG